MLITFDAAHAYAKPASVVLMSMVVVVALALAYRLVIGDIRSKVLLKVVNNVALVVITVVLVFLMVFAPLTNWANEDTIAAQVRNSHSETSVYDLGCNKDVADFLNENTLNGKTEKFQCDVIMRNGENSVMPATVEVTSSKAGKSPKARVFLNKQ